MSAFLGLVRRITCPPFEFDDVDVFPSTVVMVVPFTPSTIPT
jgi:hypothetical protein